LIKKSFSDKRPYEAYYYKHISQIEDGASNFEIGNLTKQIVEECVWDDGEKWGKRYDNDVSYCVSLLSRINNIINSAIYQNIFGFQKVIDDNDITRVIDKFLVSDQVLLRLDFGNIPFDFQVR